MGPALGALGWVAAGMVGASLALGLLAFETRVDPGVRRSLRALVGDPATHAGRWSNRLCERAGRSWAGRILARRLGRDSRFVRRLELAGYPWSITCAAGRGVIIGAAGSAVAVVAANLVPAALILAPLAILAGMYLPAFTLAGRARARQARIEAQVPELVELLVAASESGLPPPSACLRSAEVLAPPLGDELRVAAAEIELGVPWRSALDAAVRRTEAPGLASLARSLERSHRLGASVRASLKALVTELRAERRSRAEERARRAPVKMLFPLVFLILPAFLLLTVGPVLLSTVRSLH
jgi:tight adherence protein C